jgi:putative protein-disulfide isomerase
MRMCSPQWLSNSVSMPRLSHRPFARLSGDATSQHIAASRQLLQRSGGQGFPTFVLTQPDGLASRIDIGPWLGRADEWKAQLATFAAPPQSAAAPAACGPDGCVI